MKIKRNIFLISILLSSWIVVAALPIKTFDIKNSFTEALDLNKVKGPEKLSPLAKVKWYQQDENWMSCLKTIESAAPVASISLWISINHLTCLRNTFETTLKVSPQNLVKSFKKIEKNKKEILLSPFPGHKKLLIKTYLGLMKVALDRGRDVFDELVNSNNDIVDSFTDSDRSEYYRMMGEIAWLRQKNELAKSNFLRSYSFEESRAVLGRLESLNATHLLRLGKYSETSNQSEQEVAAWNSFEGANDKGQTINVVSRGVKFLTMFPGSKQNDEVSRKIAIFFKRLLYRKEKKYISQKETYESYMLKAPARYIKDWAEIAFHRGYYDSSLKLAKEAAKKWEGREEAAEPLIIAARSAFNLAEPSKSESYIKKLMDQYSGHEHYFEAQYLLGLIYYRQGSFVKVVQLYDKFLLSKGSDVWELQVRYWLWRAMKKINSPRAPELAETIMKEFPLTYYGLTVLMETKGSLQSLFRKEITNVSSSYWWTISASKRWNAIKKLMEYGWLREAEREIDRLPDPQLPEGFIIRAKLWTSAHLTRRAMRDYSKAVDKDVSFLTSSFLKMSFPKKYETEVLKASKELSISDKLIWSVMRQESAFNPKALSPSYAYGLMQLLKPTMNETAKWLRVKNFNLSRDIYDPQMNVRFGTHFLSRMIRKYKGVVPLAVASYNVGPGNLDRWLRHRNDLSNWSEFNGNPDDDMWMDELPWAETSFYVKAVMRNFLLYRIIHDSYDKLETPSWSGAQDIYQAPKEN